MSLDIDLYMNLDTGGATLHRVELFTTNITHNLQPMAEAAGLMAIWWPENLPHLSGRHVSRNPGLSGFADDIRFALAKDVIEPIRVGLAKLKADPERFKTYDAPNKWGTYDDFVPWVEKYLAACEAHPLARIEISR